MKSHIRSVERRIVPALCALLIASSACSDHNLTTGTVDPRAQQLRDGLVVSGPLTPATGAAVAGALSDSQLVYLSMPPGTLTGADSVRILATSGYGGSVSSARMVNGGFDPVPVYARSTDSVPVTVYAGASRIGPVSVYVPAVHRPRVVRTAPPKGRTDVPLNQMIVIVFSQPVSASTVTPTSIRLLLAGAPVAGSLSILPSQPWVVRFTPDTLLAALATYELAIDTTITDPAGQVLTAPTSASFTTGQSPAAVASVAVFALGGYSRRPSPVAIASPGGTVTYYAYKVSAAGDTLSSATGAPIAWTSGDNNVAVIDSVGTVTAIGAGTATISACAGTICGQGSITVEGATPGIIPVELGSIGGADSRVFGMRDGYVVGMAQVPPDQNGTTYKHAFIWTAAAGMQDLGALPGEPWTYADLVNSTGTVVGTAQSGFVAGPNNNFIWTPSSGMRVLPDPDGLRNVWIAEGINATGEVLLSSDSGTAIAYWTPTGGARISPTPAPYSYVSSLNSLGQTVMGTNTRDSAGNLIAGTVAYLWDAVHGQVIARLEPHDPVNGQPLEIGASEVNDAGIVGGGVFSPAHPNGVAFRWSASGGFQYLPSQGPGIDTRGVRLNAAGDMTVYLISYRHIGADSLFEGRSAVWMADGRLILLGGLGGTHTFANGINDAHQVAGHSQVGSNTGPQHAVIWDLTGAAVPLARQARVVSTGTVQRMPRPRPAAKPIAPRIVRPPA